MATSLGVGGEPAQATKLARRIAGGDLEEWQYGQTEVDSAQATSYTAAVKRLSALCLSLMGVDRYAEFDRPESMLQRKADDGDPAKHNRRTADRAVAKG